MQIFINSAYELSSKQNNYLKMVNCHWKCWQKYCPEFSLKQNYLKLVNSHPKCSRTLVRTIVSFKIGELSPKYSQTLFTDSRFDKIIQNWWTLTQIFTNIVHGLAIRQNYSRLVNSHPNIHKYCPRTLVQTRLFKIGELSLKIFAQILFTNSRSNKSFYIPKLANSHPNISKYCSRILVQRSYSNLANWWTLTQMIRHIADEGVSVFMGP